MSALALTCDIPEGVIIEAGGIQRLADEVRQLTNDSVLLVSDSGIQAAGIVQLAEDVLTAADISFTTWLDVEENPTSATVAAGVAFAKQSPPGCIVGLGGGSSMDCAKGINFILTNGGTMKDYWGVNKAQKDLLPMIAIPTTAGTGSETQSFALISDPDTHVKMACGDTKARFRCAILDPELTLSQPQSVAVATGIDAISHALESAVTTRRTPESSAYSAQAWQLLSKNFKTVLNNPDNMDARHAMQTGAMFAGAAIECSMLGAAHSLANPLTTTYGITHGLAVALMLPHVIRYNNQVVSDIYSELCSHVPDSEDLADYIDQLIVLADIKQTLSSYDIPKTAIPQLAQDAATQWTAQFNPRPVDANDLQALYEGAF